MPVNLSSLQLPDTKAPITYSSRKSQLLEMMSKPTYRWCKSLENIVSSLDSGSNVA